MIQLTCCSTADMSKSFFSERNIKYVCFHYTIDDVERPDDLGETLPFKDFYQLIKSGANPTTSQVNVGEFITFFEPFLEEGKDILHVSLSSGLSGSYNSAKLAALELKEKYPNRQIMIVDSLGASSGYGLLMDAIANKRDTNVSIQELYQYALDIRLSVHHWFFSTDLAHYKRGGRISATACLFGTAFHICPLMNMDDLGHLIPRKKIRGKNNVIKAIVDKMIENCEDGLDYSKKCFISNSDCLEDAIAVKNLVEKTFPKLDGSVVINSVGTVIGSHTGPGTVALFFFGDKR